MLDPCSRFPSFSVISSLIECTLEFQFEQDLVGPIDHDRVRSSSPESVVM
jgi:hypothetical protein